MLPEVHFKDLIQWSGPLALACFAGTFLGGVLLSFFWKNFGPWQLLKSAQEALNECHEHREGEQKERTRQAYEFADLKARFEIVTDAVNLAGLGLSIGIIPIDKSKLDHNR